MDDDRSMNKSRSNEAPRQPGASPARSDYSAEIAQMTDNSKKNHCEAERGLFRPRSFHGKDERRALAARRSNAYTGSYQSIEERTRVGLGRNKDLYGYKVSPFIAGEFASFQSGAFTESSHSTPTTLAPRGISSGRRRFFIQTTTVNFFAARVTPV
jgi:hypothetical protein